MQIITHSGKAVLEARKIYCFSPASWWEDAWSRITVSPDGQSAIYARPWKGSGSINFKTIDDLRQEYAGSFDKILKVVYKTGNELAFLGERGAEKGWFVNGNEGPEPLPLLLDVLPCWSRGGQFVAFQKGEGPASQLFLGTIGKEKAYNLGGQITGIAWSPNDQLVYTVVWGPDGVSSLVCLERENGKIDTIATGLDAAPWFNTIGISPDGKHLYLALASGGAPDNEARHQPTAIRNLCIYEIDLETGVRHVRIASAGDAFAPLVVDGCLYWNHNEIHHEVVVVPFPSPGWAESRLVQDNAAMPRWRPDGKQIGFVYGGWRLADWALNLDSGVVDLDSSLQSASAMRPFVTGYHEDFTPAWSPDGQWVAYHSHRSSTPVASYDSEGSTDDIYLRRPSATTAQEIRLTHFGRETGPADWSPDGRKLVFSSWEKGGTPPGSKPWIVTIDPETGKALDTNRLQLPEPIRTGAELAWSPKDDEIALIERVDEARHIIWIVSLDGKKAEKLVEYSSLSYGGLDWTADGKTVIYSALSGNQMQLFAVPRSGGEAHQLTLDPANLLHPQVSPDSHWIACTKTVVRKELWKSKL